jgi:predicted RNA-binding protein with PUA-like domain
MPNYWLLKTEPDDYRYDDLARDKRTVWDGVSNHLALKHLRAMRKGDKAFIYHTGGERALVGIAQVASNPYPDPEQDDPKLVVVDVKPQKRLKRAVTLDEVKNRKAFADFDLVRLPRLSVMPVSEEQWTALLEMAGEP